MKSLFIIIFCVVYASFGLELGYTAVSPWWTHFTYMLQHGGVMHLCINCLSWWLFFTAIERFYRPVVIVAISILVAVVASLIVSYPIVVVGASGMVYTLVGAYLLLVMQRKLVYRNKKALYVFIFSIVTFLIIGFVKHNSAGVLHLLCLVIGFCCAFIHGLFNK